MVIEIRGDIFENTDEDNLDRLWYIIENKHFLLLNNLENIESIKKSIWYERLRQTKKEVIDDLIIKALQIAKKSLQKSIVVSDEGDDSFSLYEAQRFLDQPLIIILENSYNDAPFLESLFRNFPEESEKLTVAKQEGWLEFGMGGGTAIPDVIRSKMQLFNDDRFPKNKYEYLRFYVIVDSDIEIKNKALKPEKNNLIAFLEENKIKYHILEKREMENYLPEEAFVGITDNQDYIEAYISLNPLQKDYFDLEKGFPDKNFGQLSAEFQEFYDDISEDNIKIFRKGSLQKINGSEKFNFKSSFPQLFLNINVNKKNLLKRCEHHERDPKELPNLLVNITKEL